MSRSSQSSGYESATSSISNDELMRFEQSSGKIFSDEITDNDVFEGQPDYSSIYQYLAQMPLEWALASEDLRNYDMFVDFLLHLQNEGRSSEILNNMPQIFELLIKERPNPDFARRFYDIMSNKGHAKEALACAIKAFEESENANAENNAIQIINFLVKEKGHKISQSFLNNKPALSYCQSEAKKRFLIGYLTQDLGQEILLPEVKQLFAAVDKFVDAKLEATNEDELKAKLKAMTKDISTCLAALSNKKIDFSAVEDEIGRNIFVAAFVSLNFLNDESEKLKAAQMARILFPEIVKNFPQDYSKKIEAIAVNGGNLIQLFGNQNCAEVIRIMLAQGLCDLNKIKNHKFPYLFETNNEATKILFATAQLQDLLQQPQFDPRKISALIANGAYIYAKNGEIYEMLLSKMHNAQIPTQAAAISFVHLVNLTKAYDLATNLEMALKYGNYQMALCLMVARGKFQMPQTDKQMQDAVQLIRINKANLLQNHDDNAISNLNTTFRKTIANYPENSVESRLQEISQRIADQSQKYGFKIPNETKPRMPLPLPNKIKTEMPLPPLPSRAQGDVIRKNPFTVNSANLGPQAQGNGNKFSLPKLPEQSFVKPQGKENLTIKDLIARFEKPSPVPSHPVAQSLRSNIKVNSR